MTVQAQREKECPGTTRWIVVLAVCLLAAGFESPLVWAQDRPEARRDSLDLISRYRMARYRLLAQQVVAQMPLRTLPPEPLPIATDSIFAPPDSTERSRAATANDDESSFPIEKVRRVRHLERSWFRNQYSDTEWSFLGSSTRMTILDTARTRDLRARLQAHFGDPTFTPAEVNLDAWAQRPDSTRDDLAQFAYWFVVNDSIPVRVTDTDGPDHRGLIVSTDRAHRDRLLALRSGLLAPLRRPKRAPYVDYYYENETGRWYRVGFDGSSFFREHISRRDIVRGRRPRLETDRVAPSSPDQGTSPESSSGSLPRPH